MTSFSCSDDTHTHTHRGREPVNLEEHQEPSRLLPRQQGRDEVTAEPSESCLQENPNVSNKKNKKASNVKRVENFVFWTLWLRAYN